MEDITMVKNKTEDVVSSTKKLRVGVIGCGRISVRHLLPLTSIEEVELVACCDNKPERADAAAKEYGINAFL